MRTSKISLQAFDPEAPVSITLSIIMASQYNDLVKPELLSQPTYQPGKPIEDVARDLGLDPDSILKLASNENPLGASPRAIEAGKASLDTIQLYPDGGCFQLKELLSKRFEMSPDQFIVGNGSNEVLELIGHALIDKGDEVVMGDGAFIVYKLVTLLFGGVPIEVPMQDFRHDLVAMAAAVTERTKVVFLASPNNPSGTENSEDDIIAFAKALPDHVLFVLDEAYAEYLEEAPDLRALIAEGRNVFCTRTFSKIYGLAGLRVGYGYGAADFVALLNRAREPFNVNSVAQAAACAALQDTEWVLKCRKDNKAGLEQLAVGFKSLNLEYIPSAANFLTVKVGNGGEVFEALQREGVIVRPLAPYGLADWVRITVGAESENARALEALSSFLSSRLTT